MLNEKLELFLERADFGFANSSDILLNNSSSVISKWMELLISTNEKLLSELGFSMQYLDGKKTLTLSTDVPQPTGVSVKFTASYFKHHVEKVIIRVTENEGFGEMKYSKKELNEIGSVFAFIVILLNKDDKVISPICSAKQPFVGDEGAFYIRIKDEWIKRHLPDNSFIENYSTGIIGFTNSHTRELYNRFKKVNAIFLNLDKLQSTSRSEFTFDYHNPKEKFILVNQSISINGKSEEVELTPFKRRSLIYDTRYSNYSKIDVLDLLSPFDRVATTFYEGLQIAFYINGDYQQIQWSLTGVSNVDIPVTKSGVFTLSEINSAVDLKSLIQNIFNENLLEFSINEIGTTINSSLLFSSSDFNTVNLDATQLVSILAAEFEGKSDIEITHELLYQGGFSLNRIEDSKGLHLLARYTEFLDIPTPSTFYEEVTHFKITLFEKQVIFATRVYMVHDGEELSDYTIKELNLSPNKIFIKVFEPEIKFNDVQNVVHEFFHL